MDIFEKVGKKFGLIKEEEEKSKTEQINEQRQNLKLEIAVKLYQKGFDDEDIERVLAIIESAEADIQRIKNSLIGTNINPVGDPMEPLHNGVEEIRKIQAQMQKEINETIAQIAAEKFKK